MSVPAIIYEDNWFAIVYKPCGLVSDQNLYVSTCLESWLVEYYKCQQSVRPKLMHRLDRPTSGILIVSKKKTATVPLQQMIEKRQIEKKYLALVEGIPAVEQQILNQFHIKDKENKKAVIALSSLSRQFQPVSLSYKILQSDSLFSLLEIDLITGKYHQIRAQLGSIGHPVAGDVMYGSKYPSGVSNGITLHAYKLSFLHPITNQKMHIEHFPLSKGLWEKYNTQWGGRLLG